MATEFERLRDDLLTLPVDSRASLAQALIKSLDDSVDVNAESLWLEEIRRRDAEIRSGTAKLKPAEQVLREARELLRCLK
jgi:Putative addiction module component.